MLSNSTLTIAKLPATSFPAFPVWETLVSRKTENKILINHKIKTLGNKGKQNATPGNAKYRRYKINNLFFFDLVVAIISDYQFYPRFLCPACGKCYLCSIYNIQIFTLIVTADKVTEGFIKKMYIT